MIRLIDEARARANRPLLDEMFRVRGRLFGDRLGRNVAVDAEGREIDRFDALAPLYLVLPDDGDHHLGSLRLLPTTGETMLQDDFKSVFDGLSIASARIQECTRFCVGRDDGRDLTPPEVQRVTGHLLLGLCETAMVMGLSRIAVILDGRTLDTFGRSGWMPDILGQGGDDETAVYLGMWEVGRSHAASIRATGGITGAVMEPGASRPHRSGVA